MYVISDFEKNNVYLFIMYMDMYMFFDFFLASLFISKGGYSINLNDLMFPLYFDYF